MFEVFVLLINSLILTQWFLESLISFCFVACFLFVFTCESLTHRGLVHATFCIAYLMISRGYLPRKFIVAICRENRRSYLPWDFCICKQILFCLCEQILFMQQQTFFICEQKCLTVFLFVIFMVLMGTVRVRKCIIDISIKNFGRFSFTVLLQYFS